MDMLKILSRGSKPTKRPLVKPSQTQSSIHLPSLSGSLGANPDSGRSAKRRKTTEASVGVENEEADGLDFFAPRETKQQSTHSDKESSDAVEKKVSAREPKLCDEEACRIALRSRKLKLTLMSRGSSSSTRVSKPSKSGKKVKEKSVQSDPQKTALHPQVLQRFEDLRPTYNVSARLAQNVLSQGYRSPTEVQLASLPLLLDPALAMKKCADPSVVETKADLLAVAPTGSGKTLAFLIPAINSILKRPKQDDAAARHVLEIVIVAPTRELAFQISSEARKLAVGTGVKIALLKKGMRPEMGVETSSEDAEPQTAVQDSSFDENSDGEADIEDADATEKAEIRLANLPITRADILVTTPMLLLNCLHHGSLKRDLPFVKTLVLDEADILLDPLFREQTIGIWNACTSTDLQVTCWSATMGSNIETLVADQLAAHQKARPDCPRLPLIRLVVGLKDSAVSNITHKLIYTATEPGKLLALRQILHPTSSSTSSSSTTTTPPLRPPFLIFAQTIERATALHSELRYDIPLQAGGATRLAVLHSSLPDSARAAIMRRFRQGEIWILITTDVLSRGVDFAGVNAVISYDVPSSAAAYVHRAGRTGRAGREGGVAVTFYTTEDIPFVKSVANVIAASEKAGGKKVGEVGGHAWLLDVLPDVKKEDRKKLKRQGGVEARRAGGGGERISSKSLWDRKREGRRVGAIQGSKARAAAAAGLQKDDGGAWSGLDD